MIEQHAEPQRRDGIATSSLRIASIPFERPWDWLGAGWRDLWRSPGVSVCYGLVATGCGLLLAVILAARGLESLLPVLAGGFLLIGPALAVGLYEKSRLLAAGKPVSFSSTFAAARRSLAGIGLFTAFLLFVYLVWVRIAFMLLALFLGTGGLPPASELMPTLLFTPHGLGLLVVGTVVGGGLAAIVYATTVVALPLLADRRVDAFTAMAKSVEACFTNPKPMLLWAVLVAGFIALGMLTLGIGLIVAFPLLGHATWHAYRDLLRADGDAG